MKETRQVSIDRLHVSTLLAGLFFMTYGLATVITQHVQRNAVCLDGRQAVMIGLIMIVMGIAAGWSCYLKRAIKIFPDWKGRIYLVSAALILSICLSNAVLFAPGIAETLRTALFVTCMFSAIACAVRFHALFKKRARQESGQPVSAHNG